MAGGIPAVLYPTLTFCQYVLCFPYQNPQHVVYQHIEQALSLTSLSNIRCNIPAEDKEGSPPPCLFIWLVLWNSEPKEMVLVKMKQLWLRFCSHSCSRFR